MTTAEILRAARARIDTPEKWWQGGDGSDPSNEDCVCVGVAIGKAAGDRETTDALRTFTRANGIPVAMSSASGIFDWNDHPERTHAEVMAAFDAAIAEAERA